MKCYVCDLPATQMLMQGLGERLIFVCNDESCVESVPNALKQRQAALGEPPKGKPQ